MLLSSSCGLVPSIDNIYWQHLIVQISELYRFALLHLRVYVTVYTTCLHASSTKDPRSDCLFLHSFFLSAYFGTVLGHRSAQNTVTCHALVHHLGLRICDWTQRLKPLVTSCTTTTTSAAKEDPRSSVQLPPRDPLLLPGPHPRFCA